MAQVCALNASDDESQDRPLRPTATAIEYAKSDTESEEVPLIKSTVKKAKTESDPYATESESDSNATVSESDSDNPTNPTGKIMPYDPNETIEIYSSDLDVDEQPEQQEQPEQPEKQKKRLQLRFTSSNSDSDEQPEQPEQPEQLRFTAFGKVDSPNSNLNSNLNVFNNSDPIIDISSDNNNNSKPKTTQKLARFVFETNDRYLNDPLYIMHPEN